MVTAPSVQGKQATSPNLHAGLCMQAKLAPTAITLDQLAMLWQELLVWLEAGAVVPHGPCLAGIQGEAAAVVV
jgi:hypothetical protein